MALGGQFSYGTSQVIASLSPASPVAMPGRLNVVDHQPVIGRAVYHSLTDCFFCLK
jgi:hypothetical protein